MYEIIKLKESLPNIGLKEGFIGTIIYEHRQDRVYEAEFLSDENIMSFTVSLTKNQFEILNQQQIKSMKKISFYII